MERANVVFEKLDTDNSGTIDQEEFVSGCINDERIASLLNTGSAHLTIDEENEDQLISEK